MTGPALATLFAMTAQSGNGSGDVSIPTWLIAILVTVGLFIVGGAGTGVALVWRGGTTLAEIKASAKSQAEATVRIEKTLEIVPGLDKRTSLLEATVTRLDDAEETRRNAEIQHYASKH